MRSQPFRNWGRPIHPLSYIRQERGWTHQDLVDIIARRVGNSAARREKAWRWEHWGVTPDVESQLALAAELGVPAELVDELGWPHWLPVGDRIDLHIPWTSDGSLRALDAASGAAVLDRRSFLVLGAGVAATMANDWLTVEPPQLASVMGGGRLDTGLVACFERRLPTLRRMDATLGGKTVRGLVDSELRMVTDLLLKGSYTDVIGQRMYSIAAELGRIAGWTSLDAGYHAAAERYWLAALRAAHTAGDRGVGANILKCMSLQRIDTDRIDEALAIAHAGQEGAAHEPARVLAMLTVRAARAHAARGDVADCERLIAEAERLMDRADEEVSPSWAAYFDQAEYSAQVAKCYRSLNRHQATDRWLNRSLSLQPDERSRDRATYQIWQADNVLDMGDVEHACTLVGHALPDIATAQSVRNKRRLTVIHRRLTQHKNVEAVTALDERIRSLVALQ
jgi:hypothetical protein